MTRERGTNPDDEAAERLQAIKERFEKHNLDPNIVDEISEWGDLWQESSHTLHLEIKDKEGRRISDISYEYGGFLSYTQYDPELGVHAAPLVDIWRIPVDGLTLDPLDGPSMKVKEEMGERFLQFEANFGRLGRNLVWFNKEGKFQAKIGDGVRGKRRFS